MALPRSTRQVLVKSAGLSIACSIGMTARHITDHDDIPDALTEGAWQLLLVFPLLFSVLFLVSRARQWRKEPLGTLEGMPPTDRLEIRRAGEPTEPAGT